MFRWEWYLTAAGVSERSLLHLLLRVIGKAADVTDYVCGQMEVTRWLGMRISETARLTGFLRFAVVMIYEKWMNDAKTINRRHSDENPRVIKEEGSRKHSHLVK